MKKCSDCGLNYVKDDEEVCNVCKDKKFGIRKNKVSGKLSNSELGCQTFKDNISGFADYLMARGYGIASNAGNFSTTISYVNAIVQIVKIEKLNYETLKLNIDRIIKLYEKDGLKHDLGDYQHGTYRNALKRFKEFIEYVKS